MKRMLISILLAATATTIVPFFAQASQMVWSELVNDAYVTISYDLNNQQVEPKTKSVIVWSKIVYHIDETDRPYDTIHSQTRILCAEYQYSLIHMTTLNKGKTVEIDNMVNPPRAIKAGTVLSEIARRVCRNNKQLDKGVSI